MLECIIFLVSTLHTGDVGHQKAIEESLSKDHEKHDVCVVDVSQPNWESNFSHVFKEKVGKTKKHSCVWSVGEKA